VGHSLNEGKQRTDTGYAPSMKHRWFNLPIVCSLRIIFIDERFNRYIRKTSFFIALYFLVTVKRAAWAQMKCWQNITHYVKLVNPQSWDGPRLKWRCLWYFCISVTPGLSQHCTTHTIHHPVITPLNHETTFSSVYTFNSECVCYVQKLFFLRRLLEMAK
jgi:hypothetical protein